LAAGAREAAGDLEQVPAAGSGGLGGLVGEPDLSCPASEVLQDVLGCAPSQWACYRFAKMLSKRDNWTLGQCINDVLASLHQQHPDMGRDVAIDASDLPAYSNGRRTFWNAHETDFMPSDHDATWGY
jgi:hypothetical protein